jgi:hypothetical protein
MLGIFNALQRKYNFDAFAQRTPEMNETDRFNFELVTFMLYYPHNVAGRMNYLQSMHMIEGLYRPHTPGEIIDVKINYDGGLASVAYTTNEDGYEITINNQTFVKEGLESPDPFFYTIPYGDGYNFLIVCNEFINRGETGRTYVYYFDGENTRYAGVIPANIYQLYITGQNDIGFRQGGSRFKGWEYLDFYVFCNYNNLVPMGVPDAGYYEFVLPRTVFAADDIIVYLMPDERSPSFVVPAMSVFDVIGSNETCFVAVRVGRDTFFLWKPESGIIDNDGDRRPVYELLYGL